jgi:uncharacterized protein (TIGR02118 family)
MVTAAAHGEACPSDASWLTVVRGPMPNAEMENAVRMIKLTFVLRRREDVDVEEFHRYWREDHAALVARLAEVLRIRRYVQTHRRETPLDGALRESRGIREEPYDGVAELWFDSIDDVVATLADDEGQRAAAELLDDEARFIDLPGSSLWFGEEHVVVAT